MIALADLCSLLYCLVEKLDETVVFINYIPKHWGHFLIDVVSRLWILEELPADIRIAFCSKDEVEGNYLQALSCLGIGKERLLRITKTTQIQRIIIPSATFSFGGQYSLVYKNTIQKMEDFALSSNYVEGLVPVEKIYFSRTSFSTAAKNEVGKKEIEECFKMNGFLILSPEKLSFNCLGTES